MTSTAPVTLSPTFPMRIGFSEAQAIVTQIAAGRRLTCERLILARAHGCVLAQPVTAGVDLPPFDNSAMDGFALRHADLGTDETALTLAGEQYAGFAQAPPLASGQCIRITTGALLPPGCDTVVMKENTRTEAHQIRVLQAPSPGQHVRRAGEDVRTGERVLEPGQVLTPARIALVAALGQADLQVSRRPTVAVFTTGNELVEPGVALQPGQIYNSNRELLMGLLRADGLEPVAWPTLPDEPTRIATILRDAAESFDLVVTCGAVSAGEKDHIPELVQKEGQVHFWKVRMRPGMPLLFGTLGNALFLGLPGNPVSVLATWLVLGRELVDGMQGRIEARQRMHARLAMPWHKRHDRLEFLRGRLRPGVDGTLQVEPNPADGSHRMRAAANSDALIVLREAGKHWAAGEAVEVLPY